MDLTQYPSPSSSSKEEAVLLSPDYAAVLDPTIVRRKGVVEPVGIIRTSA
jgi:hypothetical protein